MFGFKSTELRKENEELTEKLENVDAVLKALDLSMAVIEFDTHGNILTANSNFLSASGYSLKEIKGRHHKIFCREELVSSEDYKEFWAALSSGSSVSGQFDRVKKDGTLLWLEASYNPIRDKYGNVIKVVKFASDITERVLLEQNTKAKVDALSKSTAIIEFEPDGTIVDCNDNFLHAVGYAREQIMGKHHRIFCEKEYSNSPEYEVFWKSLNSGKFEAGQFKRINAAGDTLWLEASYNPVYDMKGELYRVIKFASDITSQAETARQTEETARLAREISSETLSIAEQGGQVIDNAAREMSDIASSVKESSEHIESLNAQSTEINSIISTIQEIADQTNLLALNAAIEAARAGDQGRGFAVVADEVRQLAARTSQSTSEISSMIHSIQDDTSSASSSMKTTLKHAQRGVELANETGEVILKIQKASSEVVSAIDSYSNVVS